VQRGRLEVKIEGAVLEVCVIIPSAAIGEVALSAVPLSLAGEDGPGLQPIGVGSKRCEENNSYLKHPGSPALRLTARKMTPASQASARGKAWKA